MSERDVHIGGNVALLRGDMTQQELAARMRDLGWKWSQPTVWSIEKGERPLKLAEAEDLADLFRVTIRHLLASGPDAGILRHERKLHAAMRDSESALREQLQHLRVMATEAERARADLSPSTLDQVRTAIDGINPAAFARGIGELIALEQEGHWYRTENRGPDSLETRLWSTLIPDRLPEDG